MKPIALFFHTVFFQEDGKHHYPRSGPYAQKYIADLIDSELFENASQIVVGINGGEESKVYADQFFPGVDCLFTGLDCRSGGVLTAKAMHDFSVGHPGWNVFHFHCKGVAHHTPEYIPYTPFEDRWIRCMVNACIHNWRICVADLETHDSVGCHWMANVGNPPVDHIWGGTFYWATSDFIATLPRLEDCPLVKKWGIKHTECRATSEQYIGLGPRLPKTKDYCKAGIGMCP